MLPRLLPGAPLPHCSLLLLRATFATLANATGAKRGGRLPYSKKKVSDKRPTFQSTQPTRNSPALAAKYLRHAEKVAFRLGVVDELQAFNAAAAAFPIPPPRVAATCVVCARGGGAYRRPPPAARPPPPRPH